MNTWTATELDSIAASEELRIAGEHRDGTLYRWTPIWVVRVDQDLYVRSGGGPNGGWYRHATAGPAHIRVNGREHTVALEHQIDQQLVQAVDDAYKAKYGTSPFLSALLSNDARTTTTRVLPKP